VIKNVALVTSFQYNLFRSGLLFGPLCIYYCATIQTCHGLRL